MEVKTCSFNIGGC